MLITIVFLGCPLFIKAILNTGDLVSVEVREDLIIINLEQVEKLEDAVEKEKENFIDTSGLSAQSKGNNGEDRVKKIILLYSQGLLNVYKLVIDGSWYRLDRLEGKDLQSYIPSSKNPFQCA